MEALEAMCMNDPHMYQDDSVTVHTQEELGSTGKRFISGDRRLPDAAASGATQPEEGVQRYGVGTCRRGADLPRQVRRRQPHRRQLDHRGGLAQRGLSFGHRG